MVTHLLKIFQTMLIGYRKFAGPFIHEKPAAVHIQTYSKNLQDRNQSFLKGLSGRFKKLTKCRENVNCERNGII